MEKNELVLELEEPLRRIICGISALELMAGGLSRAKDPYADALHAVWAYLQEAGQDIENILCGWS